MNNDKQELHLNQESVNHLSELMRQENERRKLGFILDSNGKLKKNSIKNIVLILKIDPLFKEAFKFNEFTQENEIAKDIPKLRILKGFFDDSVIDEIINYIESSPMYNNILFTSQNVRSAINIVCKDNAYNPLIEYFNNAYNKWDGKHRLKNIFSTYLGAESSLVNQTIAIHFFSNAVAQVFEPGRKNDEVLDLVGKQGTGKTEFFKRMTPLNFYTDNFTTVNKPDDFNEFRLSFFINDDELAVSNKITFEDVKKFASKTELTFRSSYAHFPRTFKRRWVLVRTTNNLYYLRDLTGNRRFMPVLANKEKTKKSVFSITEKDKEQIWGEAVALYKEDLAERKKNKEFKGILAFTPEQEQQILQTQLQFTGTSSIEDQLDYFINKDIFANESFIKSMDLAEKLSIDPVKDNKIMAKVSNIMVNKFGFKKDKCKGFRGFSRL